MAGRAQIAQAALQTEHVLYLDLKFQIGHILLIQAVDTAVDGHLMAAILAHLPDLIRGLHHARLA